LYSLRAPATGLFNDKEEKSNDRGWAVENERKVVRKSERKKERNRVKEREKERESEIRCIYTDKVFYFTDSRVGANASQV